VRWLKRWWPALAWAIVISGFSTGAFTSENTSRVIIPVLHWLFPHAAMHTLEHIHHLIRKTGHFTEYFVLSWLILRGIRGEKRETHLRWAVVAVIIVAAYAALDELHQVFVPGRTAAIGDVLIDTTGGIAGQAVAALLALWVHARERGRRAGETVAQK